MKTLNEQAMEDILLEEDKKIANEIGETLKNDIVCQHNWVMDGHNCGETICSKCFATE
jgi:hypothetical protein